MHRRGRFLLGVLLAGVGAGQARAQAVFESVPPTTGVIGTEYVYEIQLSQDGPGAQITAPNGLPDWLTLTRLTSRSAVLRGTPVVAGTYPVALRAENNACRILVIFCPTQSFDITVAAFPNGPPVVVAALGERTATAGVPFSVDVRPGFFDPDGDPLVFASTGLPPSLRLEGGVISGVPTAADALASPFTVAVTADDARGGSVTDTLLLVVAVPGVIDLELRSLVAAPSPAVRGAAVEWTVTVANVGTVSSGGAEVSLVFAGTPFTLTTNPCAVIEATDRQRISCALAPIESGGTRRILLGGAAAQSGDVYVTATIVAVGDASAANNSAARAVNVAEAVAPDPAQALAAPHAHKIAAGDLDGDGAFELAAVAGDGPAAVLPNVVAPVVIAPPLTQDGAVRRGLGAPRSFGTGTAGADVALVDLDNDGDLDAVVASGVGTASAAFRNDGRGALSLLATLGATGRDDRAIAAGDVTGDGLADVVVASSGGNRLYTAVNGGFAESALPARSGAGAIDVVLANVAGSALADVVFVYADGPTVRHESRGGTFGAAVTIDAGAAVGAASADFNRDGRADLVLARAVPDAGGVPAQVVLLADGAGGFGPAVRLGASPAVAVATGDGDGDGVADVIVVNTTGAHRLFLGDGRGTFTSHPQLFVRAGATHAALAPIGSLGQRDIVLAGPEGIAVFFNDGRGRFGLGDMTRPVIQLVGAATVSVQAGSAYQDAGATATDDVDTGVVVTSSGSVDPQTIGIYTLTYAARDRAGNAALPVSRTVRVEAGEPLSGGGGSVGPLALAFLLVGLLALRLQAGARPVRDTIVASNSAGSTGFATCDW